MGAESAISWDPSLSVGIDGIDSQHRELFRRCGALIGAMGDGQERGEVESLLGHLARYACEHFGDEEELMLHFGFAGLAAHRAEHQELVRALVSLRAELRRDGPTAALATRLGSTVAGWLRGHIGGTDLELGRFLVEAQRAAPDPAPGPRGGTGRTGAGA